jgi:hypothetical protein
MPAATEKPDQRARRNLALALTLFLFTVYLLVYRGGFHSVDEVSMFAVTESLVKFGRFNTDQIAWTQWTTSQAEAQGFFGHDGHVYSKKGLALSLAQAPLYGLALLLPGLGMLQTVSLLNAGITALTGALLFMFLWRMGFAGSVSALTALIFGLATIAFVYAKYLFSEPLAGFLLLLAAYMLFTYRQEGGLRHVVIAGLAAGLAVLARANNLFLLPVFGLYMLWVVSSGAGAQGGRGESLPKKRNTQHATRFTFYVLRFAQPGALKPIVAFILALAVPGLILLSYNALRSGNPLQTGYDLTLFSPNILLGLYKLLFSPLRGFFIYSPILLLSLPGWWLLRRRFTAEAWLFAGLAGVTVALFSAWSSGEGLSWGSRFLVPVAPFFALCLAPIVAGIQNSKFKTQNLLPTAFYVLLPLSLLIQLLSVTINPWAFLSQLQADFGGEFFLENTNALYDFRTSQIAGQLQFVSIENSDLVWWQPWGFDALAFGLSLLLVLLTGWFLWRTIAHSNANNSKLKIQNSKFKFIIALLTTTVTLFLLTRYYHTDRQFGPPNDSYTQTLAQINTDAPVITVAQYHYHVPMNRFKGRTPLIGFAQQNWPLPETALPLLTVATQTENTWLVTLGFPPAAPNNAAERWLAENTAKISDEWQPDEARLARFTAARPNAERDIPATFGNQIELTGVTLRQALAAGQPLPVELRWQALATLPADYNFFLQLLNIDGALVAQHDSQPWWEVSIPTSTWQPG